MCVASRYKYRGGTSTSGGRLPLWHLGDVKGGPLRPAGLPNSKFNPLRAF